MSADRIDLYVTDLPGGCTRGRLLYALDNEPLPHTSTHPKVGIVQCVDASTLAATWYCAPDGPFEGALRGDEGLPVDPVQQDAVARVGSCFGHYLGGAAAAWVKGQDWVDLRLDLGEGDGVRAGDRYDVLGEPEVDAINRVVTDFKKLGDCVVQPFESSLAQASCRLDRLASGEFTQEHLIRGGNVRRTKRAAGTP